MLQIIDHHAHAIFLIWLLAQAMSSFVSLAYVWLNPRMKIWGRVIWSVFNGPGAWLAMLVVGIFALGSFLVFKLFNGKKGPAA